MEKTKYTWKELKEFVNSIPEEFLGNEIIWWGDERGGILSGAHLLEEDYINDGEAYSPKSSYGEVELAEAIEAEEGTMYKGTPILWVD